jgi:hypothetical protein
VGGVKGVGRGMRINFNPICRLPYNPHLPHWFRAMTIFMGALDSVPLPFSAWLGRILGDPGSGKIKSC